MTERQSQILSAIIEQYAEVAVPVGSILLSQMFGISSATVRSEMSILEDLGMIEQPHTSAGRIPTDKGYRYYVNKLNNSQNLPANRSLVGRDTIIMNTRVRSAGEYIRATKSAVDSLVDITHNLGIATIGDQLYMSGLSNLFSQPEFAGGAMVQEVANLVDNLEPWLREAAPNHPLNVYIGQENPIGKTSGCTLIISRFRSPYSNKSYIGIVGPTRQSYRHVMNLVSHAGETLESMMK